MSQYPVKALLISVGEKVETVVSTVNRLRPECLAFFSSEDERARIDREIIPKIEQPPRQWDQIMTPDPKDLNKCCQVLLKDLPGLIRRWSVEPSQMTVDYTGGTRTMAVALSLCTIHYASHYHYSGDAVKEEALQLSNPWDEIAAEERKTAADPFNRSQYRQAAAHFQKIERRVSGSHIPFYKALFNPLPAGCSKTFGCTLLVFPISHFPEEGHPLRRLSPLQFTSGGSQAAGAEGTGL